MCSEVFQHPTAIIEKGAEIGSGTKVWHFAHIREGARIGKGSVIGKSVYIDKGVVIGDNCKIQNFASVYNSRIGDGVFIGPGVIFTNDLYPRSHVQCSVGKPIEIGDGASIGANSTIITGVKIGKHAMVGAGSVVTKDVGDHSIVYGNPASVRGLVCVCGKRVESGGSCECGKSSGVDK